MPEYRYVPSGVCAKEIRFELSKDKSVHNCSFVGGCPGNLKAIGKLVEGMDAEKLVHLLRGNTCGNKNTSCADQLAFAVAAAVKREENLS